MYLISAYFDDQTNKTLDRYVRLIAEQTGNDFMISHKVPAHLTISAIEAKSVEVLRQPLVTGVSGGSLSPGEFYIASVGQLLPYVFYAAPVLNDYLLDLSERVYQMMVDIPETTVSKYYRPGSWLPHITLAKTLEKDQMLKAFGLMQNHFQPIKAKVTEIGLAKVNPHEDVERLTL